MQCGTASVRINLRLTSQFVRRRDAVKGETRELWIALCEQAAVELDPLRLLELVKQINDLLEQKERRLKEKQLKEPSAGCE